MKINQYKIFCYKRLNKMLSKEEIKCKRCGKNYHQQIILETIMDFAKMVAKKIKYFNQILEEGTEDYDKFQMGDL